MQVNGSIFPASVLSLYCTYLWYSALASETRDYECNSLHHSKAVSTVTLTIGLLTTVLSVVYSAVRAGSSTTLLSPPSSPRAGQFRISGEPYCVNLYGSFVHTCQNYAFCSVNLFARPYGVINICVDHSTSAVIQQKDTLSEPFSVFSLLTYVCPFWCDSYFWLFVS